MTNAAELSAQAGGVVLRARAARLPGSRHFSRGGAAEPTFDLDHRLGARPARRRGRLSPPLEVVDGAISRAIAWSAGKDGGIGLKIIAPSGEAPLTPLPPTQLLNGRGRSRCRGPQRADLPELPGKVPGRLVAVRHLFRPRHPDVDAPADARAAARAVEAASRGAGAAVAARARSPTRRTSASSRFSITCGPASRGGRPDLRLRHDRRQLHAGAGRRRLAAGRFARSLAVCGFPGAHRRPPG